jgi:hypothetical protein
MSLQLGWMFGVQVMASWRRSASQCDWIMYLVTVLYVTSYGIYGPFASMVSVWFL